MARKILKIMTYVDGENDTPFPSDVEQIGITEYTYTSKRMGGITLSATLMYKECLDKKWTGLQYVEFQGEKYFISATPSSGKDNEDARYEHTLSFISERDLKLNNVYFYDAVSEESTGDDKYKSNSTNVVFFGTIEEFVARLNESLKYSGLDYSVVIDEGITSEAKLMSFEDQFFFSVLQEIYNTYELPFYFVGKVIHIGFTSNAITQTFKYGFDNELLSIKKNNANYRIINRCTGTGSEDNIPYYYPNLSPKGDIDAVAGAGNSGIMQDDITVTDPAKFASGLDINGSIRFIGQSVGEIKYGTSPNTGLVSDITQLEPIVGVRQGGDDHAQIFITASVTKPGLMKFPLNVIVTAMHEMPLNKTFAAKCDIYADDNYYNFHDDAGSSFSNDGTSFVTGKLLGMDTGSTLYIKTSKAGTLRVVIQVNVTITASRRTTATRASVEQDTSSGFYYGKVKFSNGISMSGNGVWTSGEDADGNIIEVLPEDLGLRLDGTPADGDTITQTLVRYITPSKYLMPPVYRESLGAERFYNALNDTYTNPDTGEKYVFENTYNPEIPREHKQEFEEIKPTIKGMTNAAGQRMDQILDIAFDRDDNDEVDEEGKYLHPYFFVKLPKYDGDYGFNLFDHTIDEEEMSISMTSGQCGACEFIIGVSDDEAQRNLVQVDSQGGLLRDEDGNVRCGRKGMPEESPQDRQNDTVNYEVWIALKKEDSTYGQTMPNVQQNLKPAQGDTFVILHIDLPQAYILNAENKLKEAIIKYMAQNNSEKFNFSIVFSRIYLEEHPDIESQLNENARIQVEYDGVKYEFYISQYTYKCLDEEALPEISVEITDTITVNRTVLQNTADAIMNNMNSAIGNIDFLMQGLRYFIRKDVDDVALGRIVFRQGVLFGNFKSGFIGSGGAVLIDENGSSHAEFDFLTVRRKAVFKELTVEELTHAGGQIIVSPASMVCSEVQDMGDSYRCFFETRDSDGETIYNQFDIDDQARCQTFNKWGNRYYWRLVVGVGENYIDLSKTDMDSGSDIPQAGDRIVQLGNRTDITRQSAQVISCYGENAPSYVMYNGINSYSLVDKNITGIIYNPLMNEPQMYSYGAFFFGDRDMEAGDATFITYQQREGDTKKKLFIQADVKLGPGSSGLGNLDEWGDLDQSIKDLAEEAQKAQDAAEEAQKTADDAQKEIDGWIADGVISPLEKQGLKNEVARIKADYEDVQSGYSKYGLGNPTDYNLAYAEYYNVLSEILSSPEQNVPVPDNFDTIQDTYYDRWVDALEAIAAAAKEAVSQAQEDANTAQDTADEALQKANEAKDYIDNTLPDEIANINRKLDGVVETWFYPYSPTLSNEPAATWIKDGEQEKHIGDMFLNNQEYVDDETTPDAGKAWRWEKNTSGAYFWNQVADSDAVKALQDAAKAQDTADQKRRVFVTTPYTPYDVGDMWTQGPDGDIMRCIKARATGSYTSSDWDKASKYTDDTVAQDALDKAQQAQSAADAAQDAADAAQAAASQAQSAAENAAADASEANTQLSNLMSDSVITPPEKTALKQQHSDIKAEYSQIIADAQKYGVSTSAYTEAYNSADAALTKYTAASPENITVGSDYNNISAYYAARQTILNAIADAAKKVTDAAQIAADAAQDAADSAQDTANQAAQDASKAMQDAAAAQAAVQSVQGDLNNLNDTVSDLDEYIDGAFRDGVIDSAESIAIQKYLNVVNESWSDVQGSYTTVYNNPYLTGSAKTNLNSAYNSLSQRRSTLVSRINTAVSNPSTTNISNMNSAFDSYNTAMQQFRVELENANKFISDAIRDTAQQAQDAADAAQDAADAAQSAAQQAKEDAQDAQDRLDDWASDSYISPPEKPAIKDEITRIAYDYSQIHAGCDEYGLGTPTSFDNAYNTYRNQLVALSASSPENISIPSNFRSNQEAYYSQRSVWLNKIAAAAKTVVDNIAIGVTNIVKDGRLNISSATAYLVATIRLQKNLVAGQTYTAVMSGQARGSNVLRIFDSLSVTTQGSFVLKSGRIYTAKFKYTPYSNAGKVSTDSILHIYNQPQASAASNPADIDWICIYEGDVTAPDIYMEAPEDMLAGGVNLIKNSKLDNTDGWAFNTGGSIVEFGGYTCLKVTTSGQGLYTSRNQNAANVPTSGYITNSIDVYATSACTISVGVENVSGTNIQITELNKWVRVHGTQNLNGNANIYIIYATGSISNPIYLKNVQCENGRYATAWKVSPDDIQQRFSDIEYLETVFPNSNLISEGALIGRMVGVTDRSPSESGAKVVAGLNGTSTGSDTTYGKALIFAGSNGVTDSAIKNATTIIYESGRIKSKDVDLEGKISATSGQIGKLKIDSEGWLLSSDENTSMALNMEAFNLNNKGYKNYEASFNIRTIPFDIQGTNDNTFVNIRQDRVDSSVYGKRVQNVALNVSATGASTGFHRTNGTTGPYRFDGNFAIRCAAGMFAGLRPMTRRIPGINGTTTYDDEEYLTRDDCIIICKGTNISIDIYLPGNTSDPESDYYLQNGQYYQIWMAGTAQRVIHAQGGRVINWSGIQSGSTQTLGTTDYRVVHLVYCEQESQWLMFAPPKE